MSLWYTSFHRTFTWEERIHVTFTASFYKMFHKICAIPLLHSDIFIAIDRGELILPFGWYIVYRVYQNMRVYLHKCFKCIKIIKHLILYNICSVRHSILENRTDSWLSELKMIFTHILYRSRNYPTKDSRWVLRTPIINSWLLFNCLTKNRRKPAEQIINISYTHRVSNFKVFASEVINVSFAFALQFIAIQGNCYSLSVCRPYRTMNFS